MLRSLSQVGPEPAVPSLLLAKIVLQEPVHGLNFPKLCGMLISLHDITTSQGTGEGELTWSDSVQETLPCLLRHS